MKNRISEIVRILKDAILKLEQGKEEGSLHDINGNKVGNYTLTRR